ncbi:MAG: hypothetical protein KF853_05735 [Rhodocyclaceae bacterium]|nr:hypothetical protein [Rhodocyclaceae bacterium]MBX3676502.1 hypothetical protein [Rhodocyclaceae bacterium]MCP5296169.1 hypothetical protein [Zoogloeaceae bacterium]MCW5595282.1 hypothetical protein [Rhodocyclaceae bacterium]
MSIFTAMAGVIPILGLLFASFAPTLFIFGAILFTYGISRSVGLNIIAAGILTIAAAFAVGLNTRITTYYSDIRANGLAHTLILSPLEGLVGQPIHIRTQTPEISARKYQYSHAMPRCRGDSCLATSGFKTPYPWLEHDYWHEKVEETVLASGFSKAAQGEQAPTLLVTQSIADMLSMVHFELRDSDGKLMAQYDGQYRHGFPFETEDGVDSAKVSKPLVLEYLLHGNILNKLAARQVTAAQAYPLRSFLKTTTRLSHAQGRSLGLMSPLDPDGGALPSTKVDLEVLSQKDYEPVWVINDEPLSRTSKWSELAWDKERWGRCKSLLKPESPNAPLMQTWHLFVNDPTGRKKVRYTGNIICDPDAIWFLDYVIEKGRTTLTKYSIDGDLVYRLSFEKPTEPYGYSGGILMTSFKATNGFLQFEWWNTKQSGYDRQVKRVMKIQLKEPVSSQKEVVDGGRSNKASQPPLP